MYNHLNGIVMIKFADLEQELAQHFPLTAVDYLVPRKNPQGNPVARYGRLR